MERKFEIKIIVESDAETLREGMLNAKESVSSLGLKVFEIKPLRSIRTLKQNNALHLYFTQLAEELNDAGYDMRKVIRTGIEIQWTPESIKEYLWRPVQKVCFGKRSTTRLETIEIDKIYDIVNKTVGERTGVHIDFPNLDSLINKNNNL